MKRRYMWVAAPLTVLTLAIAGTAVAASAHDSHANYSALGSHFGFGFGHEFAPLGSVVSLDTTTDVLTVLEFDGTTQTFNVSTGTQYFLDGKLATSAAVTAGLNVVVVAPHLWNGPTNTATTSSTSGPAAQAVYLLSPNVLGRITAVNGDDLSVVNPQGFAFTIQTGTSTVYYVDGTESSTAPTFTVGEVIAALGTVDATNQDQLDASQVNVVPASGKHHQWPTTTTSSDSVPPSSDWVPPTY